MGGILGKRPLSSITFEDPLLKAELLEMLVRASRIPTHYVDFDLLYSGYVKAGLTQRQDCLHIYRPERNTVQDTLSLIIDKVQGARSLIIIDTLNGFYNALDGEDAGRKINACVMLLALAAHHAGSQIVLASMARLGEKKTWVLTPTGRQVTASASMASIHVRRTGGQMIAELTEGGRVTDYTVIES